MTKNRKSSFQDIGEELDRRLGGLLGEVGSTLGEVLGRLDEIGDGEILRERDFDTGRGAVRAGIRVKVSGIDGESEAKSEDTQRSFTESEEQPRKPEATGRRSVEKAQSSSGDEAARAIEGTTLFIDGMWTLIADLPGVEPNGVTLNDDGPGGVLTVTALGRGRRYVGRFDLPAGLCAKDLKLGLLNGILELSALVNSR